MNRQQLNFIKEEIEKVETHGHGEVVVKIKNGHFWRLTSTTETLLIESKQILDKKE